MTPDDIIARIAVLESKHDDLREDLREIKVEIREVKTTLSAATAGLSRPEKIALAASASAVIGALITAISFLGRIP